MYHSHKRDGNQAANLIEGTKETKHATLRILEECLPCLEVLHTVEEHATGHKRKCVSTATGGQRALGYLPIITSSGRGNTEDEGVKVELAEARVTAPLDTRKLRRIFLGSGHRLRLRLLAEDAHDGVLVVRASGLSRNVVELCMIWTTRVIGLLDYRIARLIKRHEGKQDKFEASSRGDRVL